MVPHIHSPRIESILYNHHTHSVRPKLSSVCVRNKIVSIRFDSFSVRLLQCIKDRGVVQIPRWSFSLVFSSRIVFFFSTRCYSAMRIGRVFSFFLFCLLVGMRLHKWNERGEASGNMKHFSTNDDIYIYISYRVCVVVLLLSIATIARYSYTILYLVLYYNIRMNLRALWHGIRFDKTQPNGIHYYDFSSFCYTFKSYVRLFVSYSSAAFALWIIPNLRANSYEPFAIVRLYRRLIWMLKRKIWNIYATIQTRTIRIQPIQRFISESKNGFVGNESWNAGRTTNIAHSTQHSTDDMKFVTRDRGRGSKDTNEIQKSLLANEQ